MSTKPPKTTTRLQDIAVKRSDQFRFDPLDLTPEPDFNRREDFGDLKALAADIEANGLLQPLKIRKDVGRTLYILDGGRRHRAITTILIPEGRWPKGDDGHERLSVPCTVEPLGTTPVDRFFMQLSLNTGKSFTLLEKAHVYQAIMQLDPTIKAAEISRRTGETKQAVSDALRLVNDGVPELIEAVKSGKLAASTAIELIKRAAKDNRDQAELLKEASNTAAASNHSTIKPADLPPAPSKTPLKDFDDQLEKDAFMHIEDITFGFISDPIHSSALLGKSDSGTKYTAPNALVCQGLPEHHHFAIGWENSGEGFRAAYFHRKPGSIRFYELGTDTFPELADLISHGADKLAAFMDWEDAATAEELTRRMTRMVPPKAHTPVVNPKSTIRQPQFSLYHIPDAPPETDPYGRHHETDRFVLFHLPEGISLLHLLAATHNGQAIYGYRIGDITHLPDPQDKDTFGLAPDEGFQISLGAALAELGDDKAEALILPLTDALTEALNAYFPEEGEGEEPGILNFAGGTQSIPDPGAIERIKSAKDSNRDGSGPGAGNSGGYVAPDKRLESLNKILEEIGDDGDEARIETANLIYNYIMSESDTATVKRHLKGK